MAGTESSTSFTVCFSRGASPSVSIDRHISTDTPDSPDDTIATPHDTDHAGCDVRDVRSHESCASTGSTVCRICQLTEAESGKRHRYNITRHTWHEARHNIYKHSYVYSFIPYIPGAKCTKPSVDLRRSQAMLKALATSDVHFTDGLVHMDPVVY